MIFGKAKFYLTIQKGFPWMYINAFGLTPAAILTAQKFVKSFAYAITSYLAI